MYERMTQIPCFHFIEAQDVVCPWSATQNSLTHLVLLWSYLADRLELIRQGIATADHGGLDLEPPVICPLAGVIGYNWQGNLVKSLCNFGIQAIAW